MQSHVRCFPFKGGTALTEERLVSGVSAVSKSLPMLVEGGNKAATKSGALGVSEGSSVMDAMGGGHVEPFAFLAWSAS